MLLPGWRCGLVLPLLLLLFMMSTSVSAINVAFFYDGVLVDASFNQLTHDGLKKVVLDYPQTNLSLQYLDLNTLLALGAQFPFPIGFEESDVVICAGFQFAAPISGWAPLYPNIKFVLIDISLNPSPPNVNSAIFAEDQLGYIMGSVAGRVTQSGWVGTLSGIEIEPVVRYGNGFQEGVYSTCPTCKVIISYTGSFDNGQRGIDLANYQKTLGVDVMISLAGYAGVAGLLNVANDTFLIGVDGDIYVTAFQNGSIAGAKNVLFSTAKGVDTAAYVSTVSVIQNSFRSGTSLFQFSNGGVRILPCHESCNLFNPDTDPTTLALEDSFLSGAVSTSVTPTGPLAYLESLTLNEWTIVSPNFAPRPAVSVSGAHINDGLSDKVFFLLASIQEAWLFWPTHRMWIQLSTPPPMTGAAVTSDEATSVYVFGGRDNLLPTSDTYRYDYSSAGDSWTLLNISSTLRPEERGGAVMVYNSANKLLFMFGGSAYLFFNDLWTFNTTSYEWSKLTISGGDLPTAREFPAMVSYKDSIIIYGGSDSQNVILSDMFAYNITIGEWKKLNIDLPPRKFHTMSIINDSIIIIGGIDNLASRVDIVIKVNLLTDEAHLLQAFPGPVQLHGSGTYGSTIWVYGGSQSNGTRVNDTYVFNFSEELASKSGGSNRALRLKLGLGIGLSLFIVLVLFGVLAAILMKKYHLIVISKNHDVKDRWDD